MSLHDRDYMREEDPITGKSRQARKSGNVDQMLQQLDLTDLPPCGRKGPLRRCLDWLLRLVGIRPR